jgi:spore coat polysaccharide biosynthesis predicted glycosyltransferase SpsG
VRSVGVRCDADAASGVGHVVRCAALAEELRSRGLEVVFLGALDELPFVVRLLDDRALRSRAAPAAPAALADLAVELGLDAMVLDGYHLHPGTGAALVDHGLPVLAIADGDFGAGQTATIHLDQNPGAGRPARTAPGAVELSGLRHVLLRDVVRSRRPAGPRSTVAARGGTPTVLAVFGGTDPHRAVLSAVPALLATGLPLHLRAVAADDRAARALGRLTPAAGQRLTILPPVDDLPALAAGSDLVVSAAGSSVWELMCLGAPTALVCVTDNQEAGYREVVARGLAAGLGHLADLSASEPARRAATATLASLLQDPARRSALSARGLAAVDGRGRERVADALCRQIAGRAGPPSAPAPVPT